MTLEEKYINLRATLRYIEIRLEEFYNRGLFKDSPCRKEIFYIIKDSKKTLKDTDNE